MIPKLPLVLLIVATWIWIQSLTLYQKAIETYAICLESPPFGLTVGAGGSWSPNWGDWSEWKGTAVLAAVGIPRAATQDPRSFEILARIEPRDSFVDDRSPRVDPDGWFVVGNEWEWESWTALVSGRPRSIEYRVTRTEPNETARVSLRIFGASDEHMAEHARFSRQIAEIVTFVPALICALWFGFAFRRRLRAARRDVHVE